MGAESGVSVATTDRSNTLDHVVMVLFENRSLDNLLGRLYGPSDSKTFEGVLDHWFSEVPSPDLINRWFWTTATSSGLVVDGP